MPDRIVLSEVPQSSPSSAFLAEVVGDDGVASLLLLFNPETGVYRRGDPEAWNRAAAAGESAVPGRLLYNVIHRASQGLRLYEPLARAHAAMLEF